MGNSRRLLYLQHDWSRPRPGVAPKAWKRPTGRRALAEATALRLARSPGWERAPPPRGWAGRVAARPGSVASVDLDLAGLGQHVDDVGLEVGVVHSRLPKLARVPVILPVVVPVAPAVGPEPVHVHLQGRAAHVTPRRGPGEPRVGGGLGQRGRGDPTAAGSQSAGGTGKTGRRGLK